MGVAMDGCALTSEQIEPHRRCPRATPAPSSASAPTHPFPADFPQQFTSSVPKWVHHLRRSTASRPPQDRQIGHILATYCLPKTDIWRAF
jgi:hypothetical protein